MKKATMAAAFTFVFLIVMTLDMHAADADIGLSMMYGWWEPAFIKMEQEKINSLPNDPTKVINDDCEGSFMMGPMFRAAIASDWTMGVQMLFGVTRNKFTHETAIIGVQPPQWPLMSAYFDIGESQVRKYDLDVSLEHPFHKYFSLLLGLRFDYGDGEGSSYQIPLDYKKEEYSSWHLGPSAGVGFNYEFIKGLKLHVGVALLFQGGIYDIERNYLSYLFLVPFKYENDYLCIGLDNNARLSYLISLANLEIWIGGRYVMLPQFKVRERYPTWNSIYKTAWVNDEIDHFGGITFGAAYKI